MSQPARTQQQMLAERERLKELAQQVRLCRGEPGLSALQRLLEHRLALAHSTLLRCPLADLPVEQARARVLHDLIQDFFTDTAPMGA